MERQKLITWPLKLNFISSSLVSVDSFGHFLSSVNCFDTEWFTLLVLGRRIKLYLEYFVLIHQFDNLSSDCFLTVCRCDCLPRWEDLSKHAGRISSSTVQTEAMSQAWLVQMEIQVASVQRNKSGCMLWFWGYLHWCRSLYDFFWSQHEQKILKYLKMHIRLMCDK